MPQFITAWVGPGFIPSVLAARFLVAIWLLSPMTDIPALILTAKARVRQIYISSILGPVVFWPIVIIFSTKYGIYSVAAAKLFSSLVSAIYLIISSHKLIRLKFGAYFLKIVPPIVFSIGCALLLCIPVRYVPFTKSKIDLVKIIGIGGGIGMVSLAVYAMSSRQFRHALGKDYFSPSKWKLLLRSRLQGIFGGRTSGGRR
jgi:O-antigen/teichoic acid export membrane protein